MVRSFQNTAAPSWVAGVDRVAVSEAMADAWARADGGWRADGTPEKIRIGAGSRRVRDVERASGECVRWTASAGRGLPWVSIALRGASGDRVAWSSGEGTAVVTRCGSAAERLQLEVRTDPAASPEVDAVLSRAVRAERGRPRCAALMHRRVACSPSRSGACASATAALSPTVERARRRGPLGVGRGAHSRRAFRKVFRALAEGGSAGAMRAMRLRPAEVAELFTDVGRQRIERSVPGLTPSPRERRWQVLSLHRGSTPSWAGARAA